MWELSNLIRSCISLHAFMFVFTYDPVYNSSFQSCLISALPFSSRRCSLSLSLWQVDRLRAEAAALRSSKQHAETSLEQLQSEVQSISGLVYSHDSKEDECKIRVLPCPSYCTSILFFFFKFVVSIFLLCFAFPRHLLLRRSRTSGVKRSAPKGLLRSSPTPTLSASKPP